MRGSCLPYIIGGILLLWAAGMCLGPINSAKHHDDIYEAITKGNKAEVEALLKVHPDLVKDPELARRHNSLTPLDWAAMFGKGEIAELLLAKGADVNGRGNTGWTPLHHAASSYHLEVIKILLAHKAEVNARDQSGFTPLIYAVDAKAEKDRAAVIEFLLNKGADVNTKGNIGWTPLHYAAEDNLIDAARTLLAHHAEVDAKNKDGDTPLRLAKKHKFEEMADLLLQYDGHE